MLDSLRELKTIAPHLNESSDSLNSILTQINEQLKELNMGLTVWLEGPPLSNRGVEPSIYQKRHGVYAVDEKELLGYAKLKNGWELAVQNVTLEHGLFEGDENCPFTNVKEGEIRPLLECSRDIRSRSIELLPDLFGLLKKKAEEVIKNLDKAKKIASEI